VLGILYGDSGSMIYRVGAVHRECTRKAALDVKERLVVTRRTLDVDDLGEQRLRSARATSADCHHLAGFRKRLGRPVTHRRTRLGMPLTEPLPPMSPNEMKL
jgi:hypothetical protein